MSARKYELIYVLKPEATETEQAEFQSQIEAIIGRVGGTLEKTDVWGRRKLAYDIGKHKEGFYVLHVINGTRRAHEGDRPPPARDRRPAPALDRPRRRA